MKKVFIIYILILLSCSLTAQPWSKTIVANTNSLYPGYIQTPGTSGSSINYESISAFRQLNDAITINTITDNSVYPIGSMFSISTYVPKMNPTIEFKESNWLNVLDNKGHLLAKKRVLIPKNLRYPTTPSTVESLLSVTSLRYDEKDVLVFTGELIGYNIGYSGGQVTHTKVYNTMVVGTYDLKTDQVKLYYWYAPTKVIAIEYPYSPPTYQTVYINSKGVGLELMPESGFYGAIGQTMNYNNNSVQMENPIMMVFDITSTGDILLKKANYFEFNFSPNNTTTYPPKSVVAVGTYKPDYGVTTSCADYPNASSGLGVFEFKYNMANNTITIGGHNVNYFLTYQNTVQSTIDPDPIIYQAPSSGELFIACSNSDPLLPIVIGQIDQALLSSEFYFISVEAGAISGASLGAFTDKDRHVQFSFGMRDQNLHFNKENIGSLGFINLKKADYGKSPKVVRQLFSNDKLQTTKRSFMNVTAISQWNNDGIFDYYVADGAGEKSEGSRISVFGVESQSFQELCTDTWSAELSPVCYANENYYTNPNLQNILNAKRDSVAAPIDSTIAIISDVYGISYTCIEYDESGSSFRKKNISKESAMDVEFDVYPNPSSDVFNIKLDVEQYNLIRVTNTIGASIKEFRLNKLNQKAYQLDLRDQPSGVYFVTAFGKTDYKTIKITKL